MHLTTHRYDSTQPIAITCAHTNTNGSTLLIAIIDEFANSALVFQSPSSGIDCNTLPSPLFGSVMFNPGTDFGSVATYSCTSGYDLTGDMTRMCEVTGAWSGEAPTCTSEYY